MNVSINVSDERIFDVLTTAFEQGINYWGYPARVEGYPDPVAPGWMDPSDVHADGVPRWFSAYPVCPDGAVCVVEVEHTKDGRKETTHVMTRETIGKALALVSKMDPRLFGQVADGDADACAADRFVQWAIFGEQKYA